MKRPPEFSDLQMAIMRVLWEKGEASGSEIHEAVQEERSWAITTISTTLTRMEKNGLITHRGVGRLFFYKAIVSRTELRNSFVKSLVKRFFAGEPSSLVNHLVSQSEVDPADLERAKELFAPKPDKEKNR